MTARTVAGKKGLDPGTKYKLLIDSADSGQCYNPECSEPLLVFRSEVPLPNFEFAHIRDEYRPKDPAGDLGWRYWPDDLSHSERQHFSNLILLCSPCHRLIDKQRPRDYSVERLREWKERAEGDKGATLASTVGSMSVEELESVVAAALETRSLLRTVTVALKLGLVDGASAITFPLEGANLIVDQNPDFSQFRKAIIVEAVNPGTNPVSATSFGLELVVPERPANPQLLNPNTMFINPALPVRIDPGASAHWLFEVDQLLVTVQELGGQAAFTDLRGIVAIATGESFKSALVGAEHVPMWRDVDGATEMLRKVREGASARPPGDSGRTNE